MFKSSSSAAEVKKDAFKGRAEYRENGGLFIKNISLLDEGYMSFSVNFDDGESLSNRVMLNITSKLFDIPKHLSWDGCSLMGDTKCHTLLEILN